jgi:hypothetical protein
LPLRHLNLIRLLQSAIPSLLTGEDRIAYSVFWDADIIAHLFEKCKGFSKKFQIFLKKFFVFGEFPVLLQDVLSFFSFLLRKMPDAGSPRVGHTMNRSAVRVSQSRFMSERGASGIG